MIVEITGSGKRKREKIVEAAYFYKERLMPRMKTLVLNIRLSPTLFTRTGDLGDCVWEESYSRPREFTINLDSRDIDTAVETLAHEMVHVKQWARREMQDVYDDDDTPSRTRWKSRKIDTTKVHYHDWPWERQAWKLEPKLYNEWKEYQKHKTI